MVVAGNLVGLAGKLWRREVCLPKAGDEASKKMVFRDALILFAN